MPCGCAKYQARFQMDETGITSYQYYDLSYQLLDRIQRVKSRVLEVRGRFGLPAATPVLDRVSSVVQRATTTGVLAGLRRPAPAAPAAPAPATQYEYQYEYQIPPEESGIEAR
ncbi:MAG: hypothetical protein QXP81_09320 [Nitrososphaerota archaeon]